MGHESLAANNAWLMQAPTIYSFQALKWTNTEGLQAVWAHVAIATKFDKVEGHYTKLAS